MQDVEALYDKHTVAVWANSVERDCRGIP